MTEIFDNLASWLLDRAIEDAELHETLSQLASRLVDSGVPLCRLTVGRALAHPVIGLTSYVWTSEERSVEVEVTPPMKLPREVVIATPFGRMALPKLKPVYSLLSRLV